MKPTLNNEERGRLNQLIADAEKRTGAQIVLAVIERSDAYDEIPWKAFALGASLAGLLHFRDYRAFHCDRYSDAWCRLVSLLIPDPLLGDVSHYRFGNDRHALLIHNLCCGFSYYQTDSGKDRLVQ